MVTLLLAAAWMTVPTWGQAAPEDWHQQVRARVAAQDLQAALGIVEKRLADAPDDAEAIGWRARILAWSGRWTEAEADYRRALEASPRDVDLLAGLADVLAWQSRWDESLAVLERARAVDPGRADVMLRRGRVLRAIGRESEARSSFRQVLILDPDSVEARHALEPRFEPDVRLRHEFRIGHDIDRYNFTDDSHSVTASLRSRVSERWTSVVAGNFQRRFGQDVSRFNSSLTYRLSPRDALTAGGGTGRHEGVVPRGEVFLEYGRGIPLSATSPVRGVELSVRQHWLWFRDARVVAVTPSALFYLPRDWTWSLGVTAARSRFPGLEAEWSPSGTTRLGFPLHRRLRGEVFFAVGTENFAQLDQVGRFSARTWGASVRYRISPRQEVTFYGLYQDRSRERTQNSFGWSYAFRF